MGADTIEKLHIMTDGAARGNPGPAGIGAVISDSNGTVIEEHSSYIGEATNNVAEYRALIMALVEVRKHNAQELVIRLDSELLVKQLNGEYRVKNAGLAPLYAAARSLLKGYRRCDIGHIPRARNREADRLANEAIDRYDAGELQVEEQTPSGQGRLF